MAFDPFAGFAVAIGPLMSLGPLATITVLSALISFGFAALYKFAVPREKALALKSEMQELRDQMKEAKKAKDEKTMKHLMERSLKASNQQMMLNMKPLLISMVLVFATLPWFAWAYPTAKFQLPFQFLFWNDVGWLGLYIIVSIPATVIFRKLLGVD